MSKEWNVLLPPVVHPSGPAAIADFANCTGIDEYDSTADALDDIGRYDAMILRVTELDATVLDGATRMKVLAKHGTGTDNIDYAAAARQNIIICNTPGANAQSVGEHVIGLLLGVRRHIHTADKHVRAGGWDRATYTGRELTGDTLGLYGFGFTARATATLARGIGLSVLTYAPRSTDDSLPDDVQRVDDLTALFEKSDAVSAHVPLTDETHYSISTEQLDALGETGVLINTSRGDVVDEQAIISALENGTIAGAGLDTFSQEPLGADHPLCTRDDVLLTPHLGGATEQAMARMSQRAAANIRTVYEGQLPDTTLNSSDCTIGLQK